MRQKTLSPKCKWPRWEPPELKKLSKFCAGRVSVILHPSCYRVLKLDAGNIVLNGQMTSEMDTGSLGSICQGPNPTDFHPV